MKISAKAILGMAAITGTASLVHGGNVVVDQDIAVDTVWTADNVYDLDGQIYVLPGASLTIEAGTVVASTATDNGSGSLAVTRGARIYVNGTQENPVIMTSSNDDFTNWREAANEWGNLTIMGRAYISNSFVPGNSATCDPNNLSPMEGLVAQGEDDPNVLYGGGDDDDNSGSISYLSLRYGGRVIGLTNELNGLSLGGIGRGTDIHHVEIMNNVDDGIEIWGGTVNLKYVSIWNVGDDSLDIDQGWRGKAQYGLIVQGYSLDASQGSGVGDNCIEIDGAENSDAQPVTTCVIYNFTVIGQPLEGAGDGGTAWRDNARVQYRNCIWMDLGDQLVRWDNVDGDGSQGYGFNGTLSWEDTWTTNYQNTSTVNACNNPDDLYTAQTSNQLSTIRDSVFFRNLRDNAYDEAEARGVLLASRRNTLIDGFDPADAPIVDIQRAEIVVRGGKDMIRVTGLDPRAQNEAAVREQGAPDDGFLCESLYAGGFDVDENWLCNWTAADQFGFITTPGDCVFENRCPNGDVEPECVEDIVGGDGEVNVDDLLALLGAWGTDGVGSDIADPTDVVDVNDLLGLLGAWGVCE